MKLIFHLVPQRYFDSLDPLTDYTPERFSLDGFIHCTDEPAEMARVANIYYGNDPEPYYYLYIDEAHVQAPIRYEEPAHPDAAHEDTPHAGAPHRYPHIYGALNRSAIIAVRLASRATDGAFLSPEPVH